MARRRRSSSRTTAITLAPRAPAAPRPAPIVIRTPAAPAARRTSRRASVRRRAPASGGGSALPSVAASAAAGGVIGLLKGSGLMDKIPRLPLIGRIGGLAVITHFLAEQSGSRLARDVSRAAVALAAYQLASSDKPLSERIDGADMGADDLITV